MFEEVPKNCRYAYARVSSKSQEDNSSLETQKEEFLRLGVPVKNIRVEVGSAAATNTLSSLNFNKLEKRFNYLSHL